MTLTLDVQSQLKDLSDSLSDVLQAAGAFHGFTQIVIEGTSFPNLTPEQAQAAPNAAADLADLQNDLEAAQGHSLTWVNEIAPDITILPQAFINLATFVSIWEPQASSLDQKGIIATLQSTADKIGAEATKLNALADRVQTLQAKIAVDAENFSDKHAAFAELEKLDADSLAATKKALDNIKALIQQESETIDLDLLDANQKLEAATEILKAGKEAEGEGSEWVKMAAVIIGEVLIFIAEKDIDEALANIQARLDNAQKEAQYQVAFSVLTFQLVALQNANSSLASLNSDVADVHTAIADTAQWLLARQQDLNTIIAAGAPSTDINDISLKAYAKAWQTLGTAGNNWQTLEISKPISNEVSLAGFDTEA